jgi:hypothetical protein
MESKTHDLDDFMRAITEEMAREYYRIQKRAAEDPGTAGDQGEENWATLLREWLPSTYQVVTKGRILSHEGIASPQIDVLVLHPTYPKYLLDKKLYLAGGVAAAFECKVTLKAEHVRSAVENSVEIRRHLPKRIGSPYKELHSPVIYGLLAHSYVWKGKHSTPIENIHEHLLTADYNFVEHPREMLDVICVADLATWVSGKTSWFGPGMIPDWTPMIDIYGPRGSAATAYVCHSNEFPNQKASFTPIGTMMSHLLYKLAWEEPSVRRLAQYFFAAHVPGSGQGNMRLWKDDIYSDEIRAEVTSGHRLDSRRSWNEWSVMFV